MKRVVVTAYGAVSPFGFGVETFWESVVAGKNGIKKAPDLDLRGELVQITAPLPFCSYSEEEFPELQGYVPELDENLCYFKAVREAVTMSGLDFKKFISTDRVGMYIASAAILMKNYHNQSEPIKKLCLDDRGNIDLKKAYDLFVERNVDKTTPYNDPGSIGQIAARVYNITGPQMNIATACASGNNAIGEAFYKIRGGSLDIAIAGGAFNYDLLGMVGFTRLGALSMNPDPETACCPFDRRRSGFIMGSGCGILVMEELEHAKARGAVILGEIAGYGSYSDAYRATDPDPEGKGAKRSMLSAIKVAGINKEDIGYVNAHGTSTKMNDLMETTVVKEIFGDYAYKIPMSSTKSMIGHGIMACGPLEAIVCLKTIQNGIIHPTRNWQERDPELDLDYVPQAAREKKVDYAISNNFGFGGQNASVIYGRYTG